MILERGRYHGRRLGVRRQQGLTLTETSYRPGESIDRHRHVAAYFCCVLDGAFEERAAGKTRQCGRATVVYHPVEEPHADRFGMSGGRCLNLEIDPDWRAGEADGGDLPVAPVVLDPAVATAITPRLYREFRESDGLSSLAIEALAMLLVAEIGRADLRAGKRPPWVTEAAVLIRARFAEPLSVREIAEAVGVHPSHFSRGFSRHEGMTPQEMIRRLRVERACVLLTRSSRSIASIAFETGFCDHSHLTRTFGRYVGLSPRDYRRQHR